jgi:hypothetical protein
VCLLSVCVRERARDDSHSFLHPIAPAAATPHRLPWQVAISRWREDAQHSCANSLFTRVSRS